jgi:hypothetical protein
VADLERAKALLEFAFGEFAFDFIGEVDEAATVRLNANF